VGDAELAALHKTMAAVSGKVRVEDKDFIIGVDIPWNESWNVPNRVATSRSKVISSSLRQNLAPAQYSPAKRALEG
jgi:hypothetical protein